MHILDIASHIFVHWIKSGKNTWNAGNSWKRDRHVDIYE